jgi:ubiquinone/menaquinone biosynthesis C-methylase UbiE
MLAEAMVRWGRQLVSQYPPEGRAYWAARFWDRSPIENAPSVGADHRVKQQHIIGFINRYAADAKRVLEFSCGTGEFTEVALRVTTAPAIVAVDISDQALGIAARKIRDPRVQFVQGDFWADLDIEAADLVICLNAIHHMGDVRAVLTRMMKFVKPGGVLIGNIWTLDNYHDYQRDVHGSVKHVARSALFLANAVAMRATGGRFRTASYRTQILPSGEVKEILADVASEVLETTETRYFVNFACRG